MLMSFVWFLIGVIVIVIGCKFDSVNKLDVAWVIDKAGMTREQLEVEI